MPASVCDVDLVAGRELVDAEERRAVRGAVAGDRGVADLAGQRRAGIVAGTLGEVGELHALDERPVDVDLGMSISPIGLALGRRDEQARD